MQIHGGRDVVVLFQTAYYQNEKTEHNNGIYLTHIVSLVLYIVPSNWQSAVVKV